MRVHLQWLIQLAQGCSRTIIWRILPSLGFCVFLRSIAGTFKIEFVGLLSQDSILQYPMNCHHVVRHIIACILVVISFLFSLIALGNVAFLFWNIRKMPECILPCWIISVCTVCVLCIKSSQVELFWIISWSSQLYPTIVASIVHLQLFSEMTADASAAHFEIFKAWPLFRQFVFWSLYFSIFPPRPSSWSVTMRLIWILHVLPVILTSCMIVRSSIVVFSRQSVDIRGPRKYLRSMPKYCCTGKH